MAATTSAKRRTKVVDYPTSDGRPMAETDYHREVLTDSIGTLDYRYRDDSNVYVSGNMLMYYVPGNKRKHVAPDIFVVFGVPKKKRDYYLVWEEAKSPDVIIEATSKTTVREDINKKELYRVVLKVKEYFLFDPTADYLDPRLQGFRLSGELYKPIKMVDGRLPSKLLGLHLEADGAALRFFDPATLSYLPTPEQRAEMELQRAEQEMQRAEEEKQRADREKRRADRLAVELEQMRQQLAQQKL